jgi:hypothetical protein
LDTDDVRETMIRRAESRVGSFYNTLNAEGQNDYINNQIDASQDEIVRRMQEISNELMSINYVMRTWNEPDPAAGADTRSVSTDSTFDEERLVERPRLRRSSAVRPGDVIWPEDDADTVPYVPDSPIGPPPGYEPGSPDYPPDSPPYAPSSPLDTPPFEPSSPIGTPSDNSIEISRDDVIMGPEIRLDESPEIIDLTTPSPPGSPERTPPPRTLRPPPAPSRPSRGRGGTKKTKGTKKKGKGKKRKSAKKRKGKSAKKTKKRK